MSLPFYCFYLPFEPNGNTVFDGGSIWETDNMKFVLATSKVTQQRRFWGEPTPSRVEGIFRRHWNNEPRNNGEGVRCATMQEARKFLELFGDENCLKNSRLVVENLLLCKDVIVPFSPPKECVGLPSGHYQYDYYRFDFELLLIAEKATEPARDSGLWENGVLVQSYYD